MVDFTSTTFTGTEGDGVMFCITLLSGSVARPQPVMVRLSATDGTARGIKTYKYVPVYYIEVHICFH